MKLHVDRDADALYPRLDESKIIESEEVAPGVVCTIRNGPDEALFRPVRF
jgi:hypothetical protein